MPAPNHKPAMNATSKTPIIERPLIVEQDQGEVRVWRPLAKRVRKLSSFIIKIDKQNGGSPDLWFGSESVPPGAAIRYHRHLHEDEVLYISSGLAHVHVGSLEGDAQAGAIVFVPRDTWVSVRNIGKKPIALLFAFNAPVSIASCVVNRCHRRSTHHP